MTNVTASPPAGTARDSRPPDIDTMRATARRAFTEALSADDLDTLALTLRGHLQLLIPEVQQAAERTPTDNAQRHCALACIGDARSKLRLGNGCTPEVRVAVAQKLARCVNALCDHYTTLGGGQP
ncbi:DUF6415 family natural product biosynthesis protein [Streptomyces echinoruber]|uniref:Uncharacterized protein n=1 Tax=Streptomyces echinoruber TaxID=68898 RepID=A0A918VJQ3_9ACTN|nr:DUF6415 family natural product biosynthesis protein [Streptomyces echinoruber]GHA01665.1 hypothetical protein GCM10010389_46320 [Streptomyces echinoruber]